MILTSIIVTRALSLFCLRMSNGSRSFGGVSQADYGPRLKLPPEAVKEVLRSSYMNVYTTVYTVYTHWPLTSHQDYKFVSYYLSCMSRMSQTFDAAEGMAACANLQLPFQKCIPLQDSLRSCA